MNNFVKKILIITLSTMMLLLVSCVEEEVAITPEVDEPTSTSIIGTVTQLEEGKSLVVETEDDTLNLDISDAIVHNNVEVGLFVEAVVTEDVARFVFPANELNPSDSIQGFVFAVGDSSFDLLVDGSVQTFDSTNLDILFADYLTVGNSVRIKIREDGSANEVEVVEFGSGRLFGEISYLSDEFFTITTRQGNIFAFALNNLVLPNGLAIGEDVAVDYFGSIEGANRVVNIIMNPEKPTTTGSVQGVVTDLVAGYISISSEDGELFSLSYTLDNTFSSDRLVVGDSVNIEYSVTDDGELYADSIIPFEYSDLLTTELFGYITRYEQGLISIRTENGNSYSFSHNAATGLYSAVDLKLGDFVKVKLRKNENDFWHCIELFANDYQPEIETESGKVVEISNGTITIITADGYDLSFGYYGATLNSLLPIMRNDEVSIEYYPSESGAADALSVTFDSTEQEFVPQELEDSPSSGVIVGEVLLNDELLFIQGNDSTIYTFTTENTVFTDTAEQGDIVNVQYIGNTSTSLMAAVVTLAEQE